MHRTTHYLATLVLGLSLTGCNVDRSVDTGEGPPSQKTSSGLQSCGNPPDMLIVLDRSGSMVTDNKWADAKSAVNYVTSTFAGQIRFGLELFPYGGDCSVANPQVAVGDNNQAAISTILASNSPGGLTPMAAALNKANTYLQSIDPAKIKYVLLVTDGYPVCEAPAATVTAADQLLAAGIKTYVVGFGSGVDATFLTTLASHGGTGQYYQANNQAQLQAALSAIASAITCCGNGTIDAGEECDDGNNIDGDGCSAACKSENRPPVAKCKDVTVSADAQCKGCASVDDGSYDPDGPPWTIQQTPGCDYPLGSTPVTLIITDPFAAQDTCTATVTVADTTPPVVDCNAPATIVPPDAPISFTAKVSDNCGAAGSTVVTSYDCWAVNGAGKEIDKKGSCVVTFGSDTVRIIDSGGVGDHITWTVEATDSSGNKTSASCSVEVVNPGKKP